MACNCNEVRTIILNGMCDCNNGGNGNGGSEGEAQKKKYLDQEGLLFYTQLLQVALEKTLDGFDHLAYDADNVLHIYYKDGTVNSVVMNPASATVKGPVKLSDSTTDKTNGASSGVAATPKAVATVMETLKKVLDDPSKLFDGSMTGDPSAALDPNVLKKVVNLLIQLGGGLGVDEKGNIFVDFESMPTTKFEKLLQSLNIPVWVSASGNGTRTDQDSKKTYGDWYVDNDHANASDNTNDIIVGNKTYGRGQSPTYPFKTIQACANYVATKYNIGKYAVRINVDGGTYEETLSLGEQTRSSGHISFYPYANKTVTLKKVMTQGTAINVNGGDWRFVGINTDVNMNGLYAGGGYGENITFNVNSGGRCYVYQGVHKFTDTADASSNVGGLIFNCSGNGSSLNIFGVNVNSTKKDRRVDVFTARYNGVINYPSGNVTDEGYYECVVNGNASNLFTAYRSGSFDVTTAGAIDPSMRGNISAKKYALDSMSRLVLTNSFFTGQANLTDGTLNAAAFCYYSGN